MNFQPKNYEKLVKAHAPRSPIGRDCLFAFLIGGGICAFAELLTQGLCCFFAMGREEASRLVSVTLVLISVLLTGFGVYEKLAKIAGAGTLVPITGFANAVASPAIDSRSEGLILGVGAKIFSVAGPVLLYGTVAGAIGGVLVFLFSLA